VLNRLALIGIAGLLTASPLAGHAQATVPDRGELLYSNHCIECHTRQMHWRDQRLARDWGSLKAQVRRWQSVAHLDWSDEDIEAVALHLNDTIYRFPRQNTVGEAARAAQR
jgi:mono/diheme cytochrome c family protein